MMDNATYHQPTSMTMKGWLDTLREGDTTCHQKLLVLQRQAVH